MPRSETVATQLPTSSLFSVSDLCFCIGRACAKSRIHAVSRQGGLQATVRREPQENRPSSLRNVIHQLLMLTPVGHERLADKEFERQANGSLPLAMAFTYRGASRTIFMILCTRALSMPTRLAMPTRLTTRPVSCI